MDKKEELLAKLRNRKEQYEKVHLKGAFLRYENGYYPIKVFFLPIKRREEIGKSQYLDYGDLLLIEEWFDVHEVENFLKNIGEETQLQFPSYQIKIPKGYFRSLDYDRNHAQIVEKYGGYSSLSDTERKMLKEFRSYPKSTFRQWPSEVYLFQCRENNLNNLYFSKSWEPMPLRNSLPVFPSYYAALTWWLGEETSSISDWVLVFLIPDFRARIRNIKFSKDNFIIQIEEGISTLAKLKGKYYLEYEGFLSETGDIDSLNAKTNKISIKSHVQKFYFVLHDCEEPPSRIDYRNFDWKSPYGDSDIKLEITEEDIEYWLSVGEGEGIEYKVTIGPSNKEFLETVCSFSNTSGGIILLGVDNNGNVKGVSEIDKYKEKIEGLIIGWIEPKVRFKITSISYQEKQILSISVPKGEDSPYNYKEQGVYIRAGSTDRIANREELLRLVPKKERILRYGSPLS